MTGMNTRVGKRTFAGIDVGKTKTAAAVVTEEGRIISNAVIATDLRDDGVHVIENAKSLLRKVIGESGHSVEGIGVCWVGVVDTPSGRIEYSSIKETSGKDITGIIEKEFSVPALAGDDVTTPGYGEWRYGAGMGYGTAAYMTISTGTGMSVVKDGKLWKGSHNIAGIFGAMEVYGKGNSIESVFSGKGISELASNALGRDVSTAEAFALAAGESGPCHDIIDRAARVAGSVVAGTQCLIDPDVIVIGGSVANNQPGFVDRIREEANAIMEPYRFKLPNGLNVVGSALGQYNGILGAVGLLVQRLDGR